ncbi:unnamed protein product [Pleuronectes platessa]|uniref:Uncharacterized protein n=1 Tax=Pleuronectes platessa TaxID=8262 RepID=A0A9N7VSW6_PLEPL|nr:unnamed protein product [Pleuronectes platessa]
MCWLARGVQVECAKPDSLAGHIVQKKRHIAGLLLRDRGKDGTSWCLILVWPSPSSKPTKTESFVGRASQDWQVQLSTGPAGGRLLMVGEVRGAVQEHGEHLVLALVQGLRVMPLAACTSSTSSRALSPHVQPTPAPSPPV